MLTATPLLHPDGEEQPGPSHWAPALRRPEGQGWGFLTVLLESRPSPRSPAPSFERTKSHHVDAQEEQPLFLSKTSSLVLWRMRV